MQFETQRRKEFHYMLSPKKAGTLSVASFEVVASGKVFRTQPIVIKVGNQATGPASRNRQNQQRPNVPPGGEDPFESMDQAEEEIFNQLLRQRQRLLQQQMQQMPGEEYPTAATGLPHAEFRSLPTKPQ